MILEIFVPLCFLGISFAACQILLGTELLHHISKLELWISKKFLLGAIIDVHNLFLCLFILLMITITSIPF